MGFTPRFTAKIPIPANYLARTITLLRLQINGLLALYIDPEAEERI
jgi:hypothetical protein